MPEPAATSLAGPPPPVDVTLGVAMRPQRRLRRGRRCRRVTFVHRRLAAAGRRGHPRAAAAARVQRGRGAQPRPEAGGWRRCTAACTRSGPLSDRGRVRAAMLATGPHSAASYSTATALHRLIPTLPAVLHVSLTRGDRRSRKGLIIHRGLEPADVTHVARHPGDHTRSERSQDLGWPDRLVREALARNLVRPEDLPDERHHGERLRGPHARAGPPGRAPAARRRNTGSAATASTSRGRSCGSPSRPTAGPPTGAGRRSRTTAPATRSCSPRAGACCASRTAGCRRQPTLVAAQLAAVLAQAAAPSASYSSVYSWPVASATGS